MTEEHQIIISRKEKPNTYEHGKAGDRFTLCFDTSEDLKAQIDELKDMGLWHDE